MNDALTISIPRLHTDRLTLREYRVDDFALFADHLSNAESSAYLGSADRETAWRIFSSQFPLSPEAVSEALLTKEKNGWTVNSR